MMSKNEIVNLLIFQQIKPVRAIIIDNLVFDKLFYTLFLIN